MKLSELMGGHIPDPVFSGAVTADDWVLAVDISGDKTSPVEDYAVVEVSTIGVDAQLNPETKDNTYIRAGKSTKKTSTQRSFKITGDRAIGDEFQDFAMSHKVKFGTGQSVIVPYVYFCLLNGKGEQGVASLIVNSDSSGNAGENTSFEAELKNSGQMPTEFAWTPAAAGADNATADESVLSE